MGSLLCDKEIYKIPKKFGSPISFVVLFYAKKSNGEKMLKEISILWSLRWTKPNIPVQTFFFYLGLQQCNRKGYLQNLNKANFFFLTPTCSLEQDTVSSQYCSQNEDTFAAHKQSTVGRN
jgi:hypothetical protein